MSARRENLTARIASSPTSAGFRTRRSRRERLQKSGPGERRVTALAPNSAKPEAAPGSSPVVHDGEGDHAQHGGGGRHERRGRHSPPPPPAVPLPRFAGEEPNAANVCAAAALLRPPPYTARRG